jgi:hypothetical protein
VKSTRSGGKKGMADLKVQLKAQDVRFMIRCPIPTYLIGVDEKAEVAYIIGNLRVLRDEVLAYWRTLAPSSRMKTSAFVL